MLAARAQHIMENPLPTALTIGAAAVCPAYMLHGLLIGDIFIHRKELWAQSKEFATLMRDDTPHGVAKLAAFGIETLLMHHATGATTKAAKEAMPLRTQSDS